MTVSVDDIKFADIKFVGIAEEIEKSDIFHNSLSWARECDNIQDKEIAALIAAWLRYGEDGEEMEALSQIKSIMGNRPIEYINSEAWRTYFDNYSCLYKFHTWHNFFRICEVLYDIYKKYPSMEDAIIKEKKRLGNKYYVMTMGALFGKETLFPSMVMALSSYRLNLFLMWMIRGSVSELGLWKNMRRDLLLVPCDKEIAIAAAKVGWASVFRPNNSCLLITQNAKKVCPSDPAEAFYFLKKINYGEVIKK